MPKGGDSRDGRGESMGRRAGRNTTHEALAFKSGEDRARSTRGNGMEPDATGIRELDEMDEFHQPTAMFDKGELIGELAELQVEVAPETRAEVEVPAAPKGCRLIVVAGPDLGLEWSFKKAEITIGRAAENDIDFTDIAVSRTHARIVREGETFFLTDLGTDNGTFLNGVKIEHEALSSGDELIVGARTLRFVELTEAPATAAAHPIAERAGDGEVEASDLEPEPGAGASQVDVNVVPAKDGPSDAKDPAEVERPKKTPSPTARVLMALSIALVTVGGLSYLGYELYLRLTHQTEADIRLRAQTAFLQGVELSKQRRFGDAVVFFDQTLADRPEYVRAKEYRAHADKEIGTWKVLEDAAKMVSERRFDEALARLEPVLADEETAWAPEIAKLAKQCQKAIAEAKIAEARAMLDSGERDVAADLIEDALSDYPGLPSALELEARLKAAPKEEERVVKAAPKPKTPPEMERAVALYSQDKIPAAIDAAEAAGGPVAIKYIERMKQVQAMLDDLTQAHRQKAAQEIIRAAPKALDVDLSIALGQGEIRERLKEYYADALYLKGLEAYQDGEFAKSFQLLNQAIRVQPGHKLSETRLSDLTGKARELYYQGYALKDSNPEETRRIFKQIVQMTKSDNQFRQWASKWLAGNGG